MPCLNGLSIQSTFPNIDRSQKESPKWIEVEDLKAYYVTNDPPGRKYPAPTDAEFEDFHVDASAGIIQDDGPTAGQTNEAARLAGKASGKSTVKSGAQADATRPSWSPAPRVRPA